MNEADISREAAVPPIDDTRISGAISKILEHPELIGMIGAALQAPKPSSEEKIEPTQTPEALTPEAALTSAQTAAPSAAGGADMLAALAPMLTKLQSSSSSAPHGDDRRECLLCALKPYLSKQRCEAIDQMLKISRISEVFKHMN